LATVLFSACATPKTPPPTTNDDLTACGWLSGGECEGKADGGGLFGDWTSPDFWADLYLAKYATQRQYALDHIEPGPTPLAQPRAVLLITGVTIKAEWFDPIVARLKRDGFNPVVYEPDALLTGDLFTEAQKLDTIVEQVRQQSGQAKIDILAECTGGVIARHYVQSLGGDQKVSRLVTFVSPQAGIAAVPLVAKITGWPALYDLSPGSDFLNAVDSLTPNVPMTSIYTCTDEYIQPYQSSIVPGATNIGLCGHGFVGHFQTFYDPSIYLIMHDALVK
jgi:triacylglycerol lipase